MSDGPPEINRSIDFDGTAYTTFAWMAVSLCASPVARPVTVRGLLKKNGCGTCAVMSVAASVAVVGGPVDLRGHFPETIPRGPQQMEMPIGRSQSTTVTEHRSRAPATPNRGQRRHAAVALL